MTTVWLRGSQGRGPCFASTSPWPARQGQQTGQGVRGGVGQGKALGIWLNVWFFSSKGLMTPEAEHRAAEVGESLEGAPCSLHSPLRSPLSLLFSGTSSQPGPNPPDCAGSSSSASIGFPSEGPSYKASHRLADTDRNAPTLVEASFPAVFDVSLSSRESWLPVILCGQVASGGPGATCANPADLV